ncbi:MAG: hypothetical protein VKK04_10410 [Synechococcales bacterium]|nr:hypothetical protein [Synechococcales bacterium]
MPTSDEYKRQILNDLSRGNVESINDTPKTPAEEYQSFDDFARRSSRDERRQIFGRSLHPNAIPTSQMEPELRKAIEQIKPNERDDVARDLFKHLKERGLDERQLERQLGLSTHHARRMSADDVSKLAAFTYHSHPDIFQEVMADQPTVIKFLSNPVVGAVLGAVAAKWLGNRH